MDYTIVKPSFPPAGTPPDQCWKYLSSVGIPAGDLKKCCVRRGAVIKVDSRQAVTVEVDGVEFENIPVWIHTDVGARQSVIDSRELADDETYFKDAGLLFPLMISEVVGGETQKSYPQVLIVVKRGEEQEVAIGVIGIIKNITEFPHKTYRMYITARIWLEYLGDQYVNEHTVWDCAADTFAESPSFSEETGEPELPIIPLKEIPQWDGSHETPEYKAMLEFLYGSGDHIIQPNSYSALLNGYQYGERSRAALGEACVNGELQSPGLCNIKGETDQSGWSAVSCNAPNGLALAAEGNCYGGSWERTDTAGTLSCPEYPYYPPMSSFRVFTEVLPFAWGFDAGMFFDGYNIFPLGTPRSGGHEVGLSSDSAYLTVEYLLSAEKTSETLSILTSLGFMPYTNLDAFADHTIKIYKDGDIVAESTTHLVTNISWHDFRKCNACPDVLPLVLLSENYPRPNPGGGYYDDPCLDPYGNVKRRITESCLYNLTPVNLTFRDNLFSGVYSYFGIMASVRGFVTEFEESYAEFPVFVSSVRDIENKNTNYSEREDSSLFNSLNFFEYLHGRVTALYSESNILIGNPDATIGEITATGELLLSKTNLQVSLGIVLVPFNEKMAFLDNNQ